MKILSEGSIGSSVRRIEAVTGTGPIERLREEETRIAQMADVLGVPIPEVVDGANKRVAEIKALRSEIADLRRQLAVGQSGTLAAKAVDGVVVERVEGLDRRRSSDLALGPTKMATGKMETDKSQINNLETGSLETDHLETDKLETDKIETGNMESDK